MDIKKSINGNRMTIQVEGRLDTNSSPLLENEITDIEKYEKLIFDMNSLEYISSSGLRVILMAQKRMDKVNGKMVIRNLNDNIKDVFEITGFIDILTIE